MGCGVGDRARLQPVRFDPRRHGAGDRRYRGCRERVATPERRLFISPLGQRRHLRERLRGHRGLGQRQPLAGLRGRAPAGRRHLGRAAARQPRTLRSAAGDRQMDEDQLGGRNRRRLAGRLPRLRLERRPRRRLLEPGQLQRRQRRDDQRRHGGNRRHSRRPVPRPLAEHAQPRQRPFRLRGALHRHQRHRHRLQRRAFQVGVGDAHRACRQDRFLAAGGNDDGADRVGWQRRALGRYRWRDGADALCHRHHLCLRLRRPRGQWRRRHRLQLPRRRLRHRRYRRTQHDDLQRAQRRRAGAERLLRLLFLREQLNLPVRPRQKPPLPAALRPRPTRPLPSGTTHSGFAPPTAQATPTRRRPSAPSRSSRRQARPPSPLPG